MCLPLKTLKVIALIQVFFALALAIIAFIGAYYITNLLGKVDQQLKELGVAFISIKFLSRPFWTLAFGILIVAISGILGTVLKNKKFFLVIFNAGNLCFFVTFTLTGIIAIILGIVIAQDQTCSPSDPQYTTVQSMYDLAQKNLCKSPCECYYSKDITPEVSKEVTVYSKTDESKAIRAQECNYFNSTFDMDAQAIQWMEQKFDCSGWCIEYPIQMFNDVNLDVKDQQYSCYKAIGNYFKRLFSISGIIFIILAFIMGLMFIFTCCLGYHPENQLKFDNYSKIRNQK
ncbi:unnamed protein product [Paramecium primaurelia]|uniref:Tetraspanin family protein n=1 Tax=Paramecium primaurelia TaxID=5886 RepID=A0A8S1M3B7_PARPR|nr:unnamed protein product [Paramecium primaurelia]